MPVNSFRSHISVLAHFGVFYCAGCLSRSRYRCPFGSRPTRRWASSCCNRFRVDAHFCFCLLALNTLRRRTEASECANKPLPGIAKLSSVFYLLSCAAARSYHAGEGGTHCRPRAANGISFAPLLAIG